jgi:hypothetical protein
MMMRDEIIAKKSSFIKKKRLSIKQNFTELSLPRTLNHLKAELNAHCDLQQTGIQMRVAKQWT